MPIRIVTILIITTLAVLFSTCSPTDHNESKPTSVKLAKVDSVILENSEPLFGKFVEKFQINEAGDIWIFGERNQDRIFVYDSLGQFIRVVGERGKGPKGIMHVSGFDFNTSDQIVIYDASQRMLKVFGLDGELIKSNTLFSEGKYWVHPYTLTSFEENILLPITETEFIHEPHKSKLLAILTYKGEVDTVFGKHDEFSKNDNTYSAENTIFVDSNYIYTSSVGSPYIQMYSKNTFQREDYFGENTKSFSIPEKEVHANLPISEINKRSSETSVMNGIYSTKQYLIAHMQILTKEFFETIDFSKKKNILIIYDKVTKEFLREIPVSHTLAAVHNNKLYFIEDFNPDNYTIGIYRLNNE